MDRSSNEVIRSGRLATDLITVEELERFPELVNATKSFKEFYLQLRNLIINLWNENPYKQLTLNMCIEATKLSKLNWNGNKDFIRRVHDFLRNRGFINFGFYSLSVYSPNKNKSIIIVGAGIAGLMAARQLESLGFAVQILEAKACAGGRMALFTNSPFVADLGAMVITGYEHNPLAVVAKQLDIELVTASSNCPMYDFNGEKVSKLKDNVIEMEFNRLLEACAYLSHNANVDRRRVTRPYSLGETLEILIQMQEKLVKNKQMCYFETLCGIQERLISILHKLYRLKTRISSLHADYEQAKNIQVPTDPQENAIHDFIIRYRRCLLDSACKSYDESTQLAKLIEKELEKHESCQPGDVYLAPSDRRILDWHIANLEFANGTPLEYLSLKNWDQDDVYDSGENHFSVPIGYARIATYLSEGLNAKYESVVDEIQTSQNGCRVQYIDSKTKLKHAVECDAVLCTIPLGVLKKSVVDLEDFRPEFSSTISKIRFVPPLTDSKINSIQRMGYGNLNKVILCFDLAFWEPDCHNFAYVNDKTERRGEFFLFWALYKQPILTALIAGHAANKMEHLSDEECVKRCLTVLRRIFKEKVPVPKKWAVTQWGQDPFSLGSYSFMAVGSCGKDYDILAEPAQPSTGTLPRLFFAGEHTCRRYPATVTGAAISGLREAARIFELFT